MNIIIFGAAGIIIGHFLGRAIWELYSFIKNRKERNHDEQRSI